MLPHNQTLAQRRQADTSQLADELNQATRWRISVATVQREIAGIMSAIEDGLYQPSMGQCLGRS